MKHVSIVIPVYKSSKSLEIIAQQISKLQEQTGYLFDLIFVNDSPGYKETMVSLKRIVKLNKNVRYYTLRKNQGQHTALLVGMQKATGDFIITMDDDLQNPVNEIPKLINAIDENPNIDAIFAVPQYKNKQHNLWRNFGSYSLNKIDSIFLKKPKGLIKSPFRIMRRDLVKTVLNNYNAMPAVSSLIINATDNIINIEVMHEKREYGNSNYTFTKLINHTLNNILHYSAFPLKLVGIVGLIGFLFSVLFIFIMLFRKLFIGIDYPGYASTVLLISFFGGLNLFATGLVGEYLIRIINEQQKQNLLDLIKK